MTRILIAIICLAAIVTVGLSLERDEPDPARPPVIIETLDESLAPYSAMWRDEIGRRFSNAVGLLVHGGNFPQTTRWQNYPDCVGNIFEAVEAR